MSKFVVLDAFLVAVPVCMALLGYIRGGEAETTGFFGCLLGLCAALLIVLAMQGGGSSPSAVIMIFGFSTLALMFVFAWLASVFRMNGEWPDFLHFVSSRVGFVFGGFRGCVIVLCISLLGAGFTSGLAAPSGGFMYPELVKAGTGFMGELVPAFSQRLSVERQEFGRRGGRFGRAEPWGASHAQPPALAEPRPVTYSPPAPALTSAAPAAAVPPAIGAAAPGPAVQPDGRGAPAIIRRLPEGRPIETGHNVLHPYGGVSAVQQRQQSAPLFGLPFPNGRSGESARSDHAMVSPIAR